MSGRKPDFNLSAMNLDTGEKVPSVGAGWRQDDGSITIKLNAFTVLEGGKSLSLKLWPANERTPVQPPPKYPKPFEPLSNPDDDIPF